MAVRRGIAPSICSSRSRSSSIAGIEPIRPVVYGCAGAWITSCTGPISATRPAYITATRSQVSAITPMSCVISITAAPWSLHRRLSSAMICAWIDTSSAVVGSSATISLGSAASASAITTRWRMPPENWCGYWSKRDCAAEMPVSWSRWIARWRASSALTGRCVRIVSTSWRPTVYSGFSEVSGSWKIAPIWRPRTLRISS